MNQYLLIIFDLLFFFALTFSVYIMISIQFRLPTNVVFIIYDVLLALYFIIIPRTLGMKWYIPIQNVGEGYRYFGGLILIAIAAYCIYF